MFLLKNFAFFFTSYSKSVQKTSCKFIMICFQFFASLYLASRNSCSKVAEYLEKKETDVSEKKTVTAGTFICICSKVENRLLLTLESCPLLLTQNCL